jgi:hypothetical protein
LGSALIVDCRRLSTSARAICVASSARCTAATRASSVLAETCTCIARSTPPTMSASVSSKTASIM